MTDTADWHRTNLIACPEGHGVVVKRCHQFGYAKLNKVQYEKLGTDLAQLIGAPVPISEIACVEENGPFHISYIHSSDSRPLVAKGQPPPHSFTAAEKVALKKSSGLLPFLAWVAATDHWDDTNFVVDVLEEDTLRVIAIDFENAFSWKVGEEDDILLDYHNGLVDNLDRQLVSISIANIEGLAAEKIAECCNENFGGAVGPLLAEVLQRRQKSLRTAFREKGWLT